MTTHRSFVVLIVLAGLGAPAFADRPRPEGAACRKDLECASKRCGLTHGDWICMAPKTRSEPAPRSSPSRPSTRDDDAEPPADEPPPSRSEQARLCRTSEAAYRRQGFEKVFSVLVDCSASCDLGTTASCTALGRAAREICAKAATCTELCPARNSPSYKRAFGCTTRRPATKPSRPRGK